MIFTIAFFIIAIIRCLFWFQFFSNFRKVPVNTSASGKLPGVSVIVVVKNEYLHLQKLVPALLSQKYANFEIIIVDDFSTDESFAFLKSFEDQRLTVIKCDKDLPGKKYALISSN
jgi:cellulose synthase/poly-beta-1,6-N-acetylglucosamine synthase-like glycosyltransferase